MEDTWGGDLTSAAVNHLAATTEPGKLFNVSFMNDWTNEHVAGYQPRSEGARDTGLPPAARWSYPLRAAVGGVRDARTAG